MNVETLTLSRRRVVVAAAASVMCTYGRAQVVEGMAAVEACKAVAEAVTSVCSLFGKQGSDAAIKRELNQINAKLMAVVEGQEKILREIKDLKIYIAEANEVSWKNSYARDVKACSEELAGIRSEPALNARVLGDCEALRRKAFEVTIKLGEMDAFAFPFFGTGLAITFASMGMLNVPSERIRSTARSAASELAVWLDPKNPRSIASTIAATEKDLDAKTKLLTVEASKKSEVTHATQTDGPCSWTRYQFVEAVGSIETGFTPRYSSVDSDRSCYVPPRDPRWDPPLVKSPLQERLAKLSANAGDPKVPVSSVVDGFNRRRDEILALRAVGEQQKSMHTSMKQMHGALEALSA